ncbi:spore germination protein [Gracilibacillus caseinilyticus]|uniref:Spore germination protein n=2 Tax=Gracilibacillus caseinilyticus TaxID=2932256 RepID=A0ABY4EW30_9BACI|nr:spore germination protein [Gracilibacillus caseinilyticus]UOQ48185.1 spore germination protein [Gracilibacillus caseinilyticus]
MIRKRLNSSAKKSQSSEETKTFHQLMQVMHKSDDFFEFHLGNMKNISIYYFESLTNTEKIEANLLDTLKDAEIQDIDVLKNIVPFTQSYVTSDIRQIEEKLLVGFIALCLNDNTQEILLIPSKFNTDRQISQPEIEFSVIGPKLAFIEDMQTNISLIRKRVSLPQLHVKKLNAGKITKTDVAIIYIDGIANQTNIDTIIQRITDIEYDQIIDSSFISQMISDNSQSPFPQFMDTERPDRVSSALVEGKIAIVCEGSPHVLIAPTTLVEFFAAYEDYFLSWHIATAFRLIRLFAVIFSVLVTPMYVAVLTYHYHIIPGDLLGTLISSRKDIPFPPIIEVLILELTIELLREAGARLPTKIGQTIGIVGGIVIGTAAVEAGLTSNVLLIVVALAALASFTTPIYRIGNTIRLIRFPFIFFAQLWGMIGVVIGIMFFVTHLLRLTSLGRPFLEPIYPFRWKDFKDTIIRLPFDVQGKRPILSGAKDKNRINTSRTLKKHDKRK